MHQTSNVWRAHWTFIVCCRLCCNYDLYSGLHIEIFNKKRVVKSVVLEYQLYIVHSKRSDIAQCKTPAPATTRLHGVRPTNSNSLLASTRQTQLRWANMCPINRILLKMKCWSLGMCSRNRLTSKKTLDAATRYRKCWKIRQAFCPATVNCHRDEHIAIGQVRSRFCGTVAYQFSWTNGTFGWSHRLLVTTTHVHRARAQSLRQTDRIEIRQSIKI